MIPPASFAVHAHATYDAAGQLTALKSTRASNDLLAVSDLSYTYTVPSGTPCAGAVVNNRTTSVRHAVTDALTTKTTSYCYDDSGRLTSAITSSGGPTYAYGFDPNTNRTSGPEGAHTVNARDQLTDTGFTYDANGSLSAGGSLSALGYNGINQTTSMTQGGNTTAYTYAGGGQDERTAAGPTTAVHGLLGLMVETTAGASTSYVRDAGGGLIAEHTPGGDYYYVRDGQGSVIALVDPSGVQRAAYTYDPYGDHATAVGVNGTLPPNPWRWSGSYLDPTGLYKMGARYYDPMLGRFTQVDPEAGGSANEYDYCSGDPVNCSDTTGMKQRPLTAAEVEQVAKITSDCVNEHGRDAYFAASSFCQGFLAGLRNGDLTAYGFGFTANKRTKYIKCPSWVVQVASAFGVGGFGRAYNQLGNDPQEAAKTAGISVIEYGASTLVLRGASPYATAGGTAIDGFCAL